MAFAAPLPATTGGDLNTASWTTGTAVPPSALTKPTNLANGDGLFFLAYDQVAASTVTTPSTFTAQYHTTATSTRGFYLFGKQIPSAAAETATNYSTTDSNSSRGLAAVFRIPGANMTTLLDAAPASDVYSAIAASSMSVPGVTAASGGALHVICVFANGTGAVTHTFAATGYTVLFTVNVNNAGSTSSMAVLYKVLTATGATGSVTVNMTPSDAVTNPASFGGFSITEAASPVAATGTATITLAGTGTATAQNGAAGSATLTLAATGAARATATAAATITLTGKAETPAISWVRQKAGGNQIIGHRDGAWGTYGEETRAGYNATSAWLSTAALEISFWVTSDGVYVASHDQDTLRVFGTSHDIPTSTWASISSLTTTVAGNPIATVDQIIADHPGRLFVIENKSNTNNATRAAYIDALCSGRWISKCFGPSGIGWCNSAAAFAAPAMAYFFPTDLGNIANAFTGWTGSTQLIYELADYSSSGASVPTQANATTFYTYTLAHSLMTWASVIDTSTQKTTANTQASTAGATLDGYMMSNVPALTTSDATSAASGTATLTLTGAATAAAPVTGTATLTLAGTGSTSASPTAAATITLAATGTGRGSAVGAATVTLAGTAAAVGVAPAAAATLTLTATGTARAAATASATVTLTGTGTSAAVSPAATATVTLTATGTARATAAATATLTFAGSGTSAAPASATATVTLTGTGTAAALGATTGTATITLTAVGVAGATTTGAATLTLTATGTGKAPTAGTATVTLTAAGTSAGPAAGAGTVTLTATAAALARAAGTATTTLTGAATVAARAGGSATVTLAGTGTATNAAGVRNVAITVTTGTPRHPTAATAATRQPTIVTGTARHPSVTTGPQRWDT